MNSNCNQLFYMFYSRLLLFGLKYNKYATKFVPVGSDTSSSIVIAHRFTLFSVGISILKNLYYEQLLLIMPLQSYTKKYITILL